MGRHINAQTAALGLRFGADRMVRTRIAVIGSGANAHELAHLSKEPA